MNINKTQPKTLEYTVNAECELLTFLLVSLPPKYRSNAKAWLKYHSVTVDGNVVTQYNHRLICGQKVVIKPQSDNRTMPGLIYEDEELIVMNKPAGLLSIATEREREKTAYHMLTDQVKKRDPQGRIFVVHRLDRDTSGVLLAAKNEELKRLLQDNWADLVKTRGYTALVEGTLEEKTGTLRSWLRETSTHLVYESGRGGDGLEAITEYRVLRENGKYSLLDIRLRTGRKNQIRVQLSGIGNPIAGDDRYGAKTDPLKRLCLHAHLLELSHPVTQKLLSFPAELPTGFLRPFK